MRGERGSGEERQVRQWMVGEEEKKDERGRVSEGECEREVKRGSEEMQAKKEEKNRRRRRKRKKKKEEEGEQVQGMLEGKA